ncbi:hypothetical protein SNEBB_007980, partial [Seison nebaliae]
GIPYVSIPIITPLQTIAVRLHTEQLTTYCTIYLNPQGSIPTNELNQLIHTLPQPFILFGDFNARHAVWGDTVSNPRGTELYNFIQNNNLCILFPQGGTHWQIATRTTSTIDFAICSPTLVSDYTCQVSNDMYHSDHFPICLKHIHYQPPHIKPRWRFEKADWTKFRNNINLRDNQENENTTVAVTNFTKIIQTAATNSIPKTTPHPHRLPTPWMTEKIKTLIRMKRRCQKRARTTNRMEDTIFFKRIRALVRKEIRLAKQASFKLYVESINERTPMTSVWKKVNRLRGRKIGPQYPILQVNNRIISDHHEVAEAFGVSLSNISDHNYSRPNQFLQQKRIREQQPINLNGGMQETYNLPYTMKELALALRKSGKTAAGPDDIHYSMLRQLPTQGKEYLLDLYNKIWRNGEYPEQWRLSHVIMFPKPGKNTQEPNNYRPISLTSCMSKIMERMVNMRLQYHLEKEDLISKYQFGFRRHRSSIEALTRVVTIIQTAINRREQCIGVFFDLEKAYDTTWRRHIIDELYRMGVRGNLLKYVHNYMQNRRFRIKLGDTLSTPYSQLEGVPQGGVLSVTLFLVAINGLTQAVGNSTNPTLFVDDFGILIVGNNFISLCRQAQLAINKAVNWAQSKGFKFNANKTNVVHFHRRRCDFGPIELTLQRQLLTVRTEVRFLGLYLDYKLQWKTQVEQLRKSCFKALDVLKVLSHTKWGASRKILIRIYHALVRSKLDYGCQIYNSASPAILRHLDPIHNAALRIATGAFKSSPITSLLAESGEPALADRRLMLSQQLYCKIASNPNCPTYQCVMDETADTNSHRCTTLGKRVRASLAENNLQQPDVELLHWPNKAPWMQSLTTCLAMHIGPKANITPIHHKMLHLAHRMIHRTNLNFYTDGSKTQLVGYAAITNTIVYAGSLRPSASIFTAELTAILSAFNHAVTTNNSLTVFTDSKSSIEALNDISSLHPLIVQIQDAARVLRQRGFESAVCWVPSHTGVDKNEEADTAAKAASHLPLINKKLPYRDYYPQFKRILYSRHNQHMGNIFQ